MSLKINNIFPGELNPDATVGGCIDIFENVWHDPGETIRLVENETKNPDSGVYWQKAGTLGLGAYQDIRTNKMLSVTHLAEISDNKILQNIHNQFNVILLSASNLYAQRYGINEGLWHEHYHLLKYSGEQEYKAHYDGSTSIGRVISAVCYLNDDYEGGEIEFPHFGIKIKPEAGMLILFPSNFAYTHIAHPVSSGTKYNLVTWITDRFLDS